MKTTCLSIAIGLLSSWFAYTQVSYDFKALKEQHDREIEQALVPINNRYKASLQQLLRRATQGNDLDTAVQIKQILESIPTPSANIKFKYIKAQSASPQNKGFGRKDLPTMDTENPEDVFHNKPIYFDMKTGNEIVYSVGSERPLNKLIYHGVAFFNFAIEVRNSSGQLMAQSEICNDRNVFKVIDLPLPSLIAFTITIKNHPTNWMLIESIQLQ